LCHPVVELHQMDIIILSSFSAFLNGYYSVAYHVFWLCRCFDIADNVADFSVLCSDCRTEYSTVL